jgi:predicted RND superfamily exporter protein
MGVAVERRPGRVLVTLLVVTVVLGGFASRQSTDTDLTAFAPEGELAETLRLVQDEFAAGGVSVRIVVDAGPGGNVLDEGGRRAAEALRDALAGDDVVAASLADSPIALLTFLDDPTGAMLSTDRIPDGDGFAARAGLVIVGFDPDLSPADAGEAELRVDEIVQTLEVSDGVEVGAFGQTIISDRLQRDSEEEMGRLLGLSMLLILGILALQFRRVSDVVLGILGLVVAITWMFGIGVLLGPDFLGVVGPFTQVSLIVPVLIVGLGIDYAIHLTSRYKEERNHGLSSGRAANAAVRTVGGALVLATVATVLGFLTNLVSPLPPLRDFGIFMGVGVVASFLVMALLVPAARNVLDTRRARRTRSWAPQARSTSSSGVFARATGAASVLAHRVPKVVLAITVVVTLAAAGAATQIGSSFSEEDFIPADSDVAILLDRIDELFGGDLAEVTYVVVDGAVDEDAGAVAVERYVAQLASVPAVRTSDAGARVEVLRGDGDRLVLQIDTNAGQEGARALQHELVETAAVLEDAGLTVRVASEPLVVEDTLDALTASQAQGIAFTIVAALILVVSYYGVVERRPLLGVITMVPSMAVVAWVLGTMYLLGYSFNVLTAMVASLGIGIGVPFGIHITHRFLEDRRRYETIDEAIAETLTHTGGAMAGSAATTAAGFGVLVLASLAPMQQFGTIVAIAILYSFLAAVLVQPSCLKLWGEWRARRGDVAELAPDEDHRVLEPV